MKESSATGPSARETEDTGLRWPRTWKGVYLLVICSFLFWIALLITLTNVAS